MSRSNIDAPALAALAAANVKAFCLLELAFDGGTVYLCDLAFSVTWSGNTYLPAAGIGSIEVVTETECAGGLCVTVTANRPVSARICWSDGVVHSQSWLFAPPISSTGIGSGATRSWAGTGTTAASAARASEDRSIGSDFRGRRTGFQASVSGRRLRGDPPHHPT